ncbi:glycerophosphodiester phosphodiesterase [Gleimia sp. 6138-11-ORH1]|uniref:glycerophosphodiester phosphodiesterase family protein n=1 Tax=Gleimia sp. 6138-11-ORH1 TaxID=2973937 RepID=UPI00216AB062|nr:glycerophosphodiester phosphodiesterase family protein [Gleimia sp. 6138-11-ORH1]MCS4484080.1 glycerophosphodiester phosphodiesterase [Gleimia sp. 6138-11-ORH1]
MYQLGPNQTPIVIAHRGGALVAPENSWESLQYCYENDFNYVETDAHLSADGEVILVHDPVLDRVSNGTGLVANHTWDELSRLRIKDSETSFVRLADALETYPDLAFNIDAKEDEVSLAMVDVILAAKATERVCLASFSTARLWDIRSYAPEIATSLGQTEAALLWTGANLTIPARKLRIPGPAESVVAAQVPLKMGPLKVIDRRFVAYAHQQGIAVHVWTLNTEAEILQALQAGADGIVTDDPQLATQVIAKFTE